ncbi:exodeoxyribonuclease V subunit gamma [uncultured Tessaracoccus sp.]|uniref:exodeoxyribonuclease V subunit gamma n=1 Tax=uncultured Tessaracoccus sp. TaxID=905023 RepID=UPI00262BFACA|nr:exodeoxyribonuclease V subunit gamma [uncultured Tessaracoccus sp.]
MQVRLGTSWRAMVPELVAAIRDELRSPFARGMVVVDSPGSARLLSQEIATIEGISAGIDFFTIGQLTSVLAADAAVSAQWDAWRGSRLVTAIAEQVDAVAHLYPPLQAFLAIPGRKVSACGRFAQLFRRYAEHAPSMVEHWLAGDDGSLPEHLAWQPALLRSACELLQFNPVQASQQLTQAAAQLERPTWVFCVDEIAPSHHPLLQALSPRVVWSVGGAPDWLCEVAHDEPVRVGKPLRAVPEVQIHGSHSQLRQAEVLRDELLRCFETRPHLEPRDVRIVCPNPDAWAPVLNAVFRSSSHHPGGALRVAEVRTSQGGNHAIDAILATFDLVAGRTTVNEVVEFLLLPAISSRWGFANRRTDLLDLVDAAEVHWGLGGNHRAEFGLPRDAVNTWQSGIDALLTGIAMGGVAGPRGVLGVEDTTSNDLDLIGALTEVIGRIWALRETTKTRLTVSEWAQAALQALEQLVGLSFEDGWMEQQAATVFERIAQAHESSTVHLGHSEFRRLIEAELPARWHRPPLGNGELHVVAPHEACHIDAGLVAMIGLDDVTTGALPDELPDTLPDRGRVMQRQLLAHASAAEQLLIITATHSERTGNALASPVSIRLLLRQLGVPFPGIVQHAPQPFNASQFRTASSASFDGAAFEGARAALEPSEHRAIVERRKAALHLPIQAPVEQLALTKLKAFLLDPAREFLAQQATIYADDDITLDDRVPLQLGGLASWKIREAFIQGRMRHIEPQELLRRAEQSQLVPQGAYGRAMAANIGRQADAIVAQSTRLMAEAPQFVDIDVEVAGTRLTGIAQVHGGHIVVPAAGSGTRALLQPWLHILALACQGVRVSAVVLRPGRDRTKYNELRQLPPERAAQLLELYVRAHTVGRSRLLPVPFEPAFSLVMEQRTHRFNRRDWTHPAPFAFKKWAHPDERWTLFYTEPARQLFDDPPTSDDPPGPSNSIFERWAAALYQPLAEQGGSW